MQKKKPNLTFIDYGKKNNMLVWKKQSKNYYLHNLNNDRSCVIWKKIERINKCISGRGASAFGARSKRVYIAREKKGFADTHTGKIFIYFSRLSGLESQSVVERLTTALLHTTKDIYFRNRILSSDYN